VPSVPPSELPRFQAGGVKSEKGGTRTRSKTDLPDLRPGAVSPLPIPKRLYKGPAFEEPVLFLRKVFLLSTPAGYCGVHRGRLHRSGEQRCGRRILERPRKASAVAERPPSSENGQQVATKSEAGRAGGTGENRFSLWRPQVGSPRGGGGHSAQVGRGSDSEGPFSGPACSRQTRRACEDEWNRWPRHAGDQDFRKIEHAGAFPLRIGTGHPCCEDRPSEGQHLRSFFGLNPFRDNSIRFKNQTRTGAGRHRH
jgi:hypothetical protein